MKRDLGKQPRQTSSGAHLTFSGSQKHLTSNRHQALVRGLQSPLEHADVLLEREWLVWTLQSNHVLRLECFLVHVRMSLVRSESDFIHEL